MKENCVIFDTNILLEYKSELNDIKTKISETSDIFLPRIVIDEIIGQKSRNINDEYLRIKGIIDKNSDLFNYEEKFKLKDVLKKNEDDIKNWLNKYSNKNILEYENVDLKDVLERVKYKKAPFINEQGSSDKGFKDTIIWLSILDNDSIKRYKKIIFISNDKTAFVKRKNELYEEYALKNSNSIEICSNIDDLYRTIGLPIENEDNSTESTIVNSNDFNIENFSDLKQGLNKCICNILYTTVENQWGEFATYTNFNIYDKMTEENTRLFLSSLGNYLKENIFFDYIDITELLRKCNIDSAGENVSYEYLKELNETYNLLLNNKELYDPLINYIMVEFNKVYKFKERKNDFTEVLLNDDDLPF